MKPLLAGSLLLTVLWLSAPLSGNESAELTLVKGPDLGGFGTIMDSCEGRLKLASGKDLNDLRSFNYYFCTGVYSIILDGPPGATVTLFADFDYGRDTGFLVIRKKDKNRVWISELEGFPKRKWHSLNATEDNGAYQVFYREGPKFSQSISSVRWGKWWEGGKPN